MNNFVKEECKLSQREVMYWSKVFNNNLLIGTEMEVEFPNEMNLDNIRRDVKKSGDFRRFGEGIQDIKSDGSLYHGLEILTPGRAVYGFLEQYSMFNNVLEQIEEYEPYIHPRASQHCHILLDYDGVDKLEKRLPSVIFRNILALTQLFMPSLAFISSTLTKEYESITRYDCYCLTDYLKKINIKDDTTSRIFETMNNRYNALNLSKMRGCFDAKDTFNRFHIEFRFPDCALFPSQQASLTILYKALIMKAIKLSEFGIIDTNELISDYSVKKLNLFKNNGDIDDYNEDSVLDIDNWSSDNDDRMSINLTEEYMVKMKELSKFMIDFFENDIIAIDSIALPVLRKLSVTPVSIISREINSSQYQDINMELDSVLDGLIQPSDCSLEELSKIITFGDIKGCSMEEWYEKVGNLIAGTEPLQQMIERLSKIKKLKFTEKTGFYYEI